MLAKGPWKTHIIAPDYHSCVIRDADGNNIARTYRGKDRDALAIGRVMAAAPDLLDALESAEKSLRLIRADIETGIEFDGTHLKHMRRDSERCAAAIAKAKGES